MTPVLGNELATVLIAAVCIALLVWVTLTDAKIKKARKKKRRNMFFLMGLHLMMAFYFKYSMPLSV